MVLGELVINTIMIIISIGLFLITNNFKHIGNSQGTFGAAFWPKIILVLLFIFSFIQILISIKKENKLPDISIKFPKKTLIFSIIIISLYIICIDILGFILSTLLFQVIFLINLHVKKISTIILVPVIMTAIFYFLFIKVMLAPLPRGMGIFRMFSLWFY